MKTILSIFMLMVGAVLPQALLAESLPLIQNVNAYESMSLNGEWNYIVDVQEEGYYDYRMKPYPWGCADAGVSHPTLLRCCELSLSRLGEWSESR